MKLDKLVFNSIVFIILLVSCNSANDDASEKNKKGEALKESLKVDTFYMRDPSEFERDLEKQLNDSNR